MYKSEPMSFKTIVFESFTKPCNACCPWRSPQLQTEQEALTRTEFDIMKTIAIPSEDDSLYDKMTYAVRTHDIPLLQHLIECGSGDFWGFIYQFLQNNERQINPVELACTLGYTDIVHVYLDNGCSPDLPTTHGRLIHSVLYSIKSCAIKLTDGQELIGYLCEKGCNVNIRDINTKTTLLHAAEIGDVKIMESILSKAKPFLITISDVPNKFTPLHMSAMKGDLDCVLAILKYCDSSVLNSCDAHGNTPLALALKAMNKNLQYMNNLVQDPVFQSKNQIQIQNLTCLQHNSVAIVEALLTHGTEPDSTSCLYHSILFQALKLVSEDETTERLLSMEDCSATIQFIASRKIKDLKYSKDKKSQESVLKEQISPYTGIVRLLVLHGFKMPEEKENWYQTFPILHDLINEIFDFVDNFESGGRVLKLMHLSKQVIRSCLAANQNLHLVEKLSLPPSLCAYIKLQIF